MSTTSPTSTSIYVSWSVPIPDDINGVLTHYTVTYYGEEIDTTVRIIQVNTSSHEDMNLTLTDLEEYTIYSVNVSVYTKVGRGPDVLAYQRTLQDGEYSSFFLFSKITYCIFSFFIYFCLICNYRRDTSC